MEQETLALLTDLHARNKRQGPGSDAVFSRALELAGIDTKAPLQIADIGCGTGSSTVALAQSTNASITAVDLVKEFLAKLDQSAAHAGMRSHIKTIVADMSDLPFKNEQFDVIWSEGAIYNIGFLRGIQQWREYLKPYGTLVVTEITWLTPDIPKELRTYWESEYPEIALASKKIQQLEDNGYTPIGYFVLTSDCWINEYYEPLKSGFKEFLERHENNELAKALVEAEQQEIAFYEKYRAYFSYGCYIARRTE